MKKIIYLLAPQGAGVSLKGFEQIPFKLQDVLNDAEVVEPQNIFSNTNNKNLRNLDLVLEYTNRLANKTSQIIQDGNVPITIGGDHSIALGTILGIKNKTPSLGVVWIDAHADMNTHLTTITGNIHGMPLSALQGLGSPLLIDELAYQKFIKTENIVILGVRSVDPLELKLMEQTGIKYIPFEEVKTKGLELVLREINEYLKQKVEKVHISFDLDVMNPKIIPGVSVPVEDGFNKEEAFQILDYLFKNFSISSFDLVEYNPIFDKEERTKEFIVLLINYLKEKFSIL